MKLMKAFRISMMVVGLGTALMVAGAVRAESDAKSAVSNVEVKGTPSQDATQSTAADNDVVIEEVAAPAGLTMESGLLTLILFMGMGSIFVYARMATRSERRRVQTQDAGYSIGARVREFSA